MALTCLSLLLAACGQSVILQAPAERLLSSFVYQHTGVRPADVRCPSGIPAKAGGAFQCHFTAPDGKYTAYMMITAVQGQSVKYFIRTIKTG